MEPGKPRSLGAAAVTALWLAPPIEEEGDGYLVVLHAGDTSAMLLSGTDARWLTHDHNAPSGGLRNYMGMGPGLAVESRRVAVEPGDLLVLVTDGVTRAMQLDAIRDAVLERPLFAGHFVARELCERARRRGSGDDITAVVIEIEEW